MKEISTLPVYPIIYHEGKVNGNSIKEHLENRGREFFRLRNATQRMYTGESLDYGRRWIDNRVMVDYQTYVRLHPDKIILGELEMEDKLLIPKPINGCNCLKCLDLKDVTEKDSMPMFEKYDHILKEVEGLTTHQYMLLTNRVPGYYLQDRKWVKLDVAKLSEYTPKTESFKNLVLPLGHKDVIEALIRTRRSSTTKGGSRRGGFSADLIRGKGKGLVILLHGSPGVGKTSTAECVAELTNLPLFPITCGDIGTNAAEVEGKLKEHFELAQQWNAVLLLDEADVFLQARDVQSSSLKRNSLVSVFLRVLEYYTGILFLTTNRVGDFDEAFKSRIHVILYYPKLEQDAVTKIWRNLIDSLEELAPGVTLTEAAETYIFENSQMRSTKWNGRQVRNAFQTAIALAEYEQDPDGSKGKYTVNAKHFKTVVELSAKFEQYMKKTRGGDDSQLAKYGYYRIDDMADANGQSDKSRRQDKVKQDKLDYD
ncbi:hypothetical protein MMC25_003157 [Agyrium rufum]|nr:hypothetical protein [Agyrium rufum]